MKHLFKPKQHVLAGIALVAAILACSAPAAQTQAPTEAITQEVAGITETAASTEIVTQAATEPATAPPAAGVTATTAPSATPTPTATTCLYNSVFVSDVTIPDATEIQVGNAFTKTWQLKNNGCQTWPSGITLVFVSGNQMSGPASSPPGGPTAPGATQDFTVNLTAPGPAGDYQGQWQLRTPDPGGFQFGQKIWVKIKSTSPAPPTVPPPPTPVPGVNIDFTAGYAGLWQCDVFWRFGFQITNTGSVALESMGMSISNGLAGGSTTNTPFEQVPPVASPACLQAGLASLAPASARWVSAGLGTTHPGSGSAKATITMCSEDNQGGTCKTVKLNFSY